MKNALKNTLITLAFAASLAQVALPAFAATSVRATVNGMVCAFCAQGIEKRISKMRATKAVFVDLKKKTVAVEAKDGQTLDEKAITAEITDAGYDVVKLETVQKSVAEIKAELKGGK
jgi:copper chaperone CopZ